MSDQVDTVFVAVTNGGGWGRGSTDLQAATTAIMQSPTNAATMMVLYKVDCPEGHTEGVRVNDDAALVTPAGSKVFGPIIIDDLRSIVDTFLVFKCELNDRILQEAAKGASNED